MQIELKPCPFCGCKDFLKVEPCQFPPDEEGDAWQWGYNVVCDASGFEGTPKGCGASSSWQETPDEAVVSWNRRAIEAVTPPDVAGLIEQLDAFAAGCRGSMWQSREETIRLCEQAATALRLSAGGGWRTIDSAPELDRVIVAGWQKPTRSCAGYWWMHEDVIVNGKPNEHHNALLWQPFPSRPDGLPASPTVEACHVE